ncbi:flavin reductase family protein [Streptomyces sp. T028]|uniref:flavin reductase family protein n=1 Tax=Streptomyces sp. T028 TaxID=3394379 RepID=UPI003A8900EF
MTSEGATVTGPADQGGSVRAELGSDLRRVMAEYPTGVVLGTAYSADGPVGMTCNSFTSVSLEPRLVSICAVLTSSTWPLIRAGGHFCVNVVASHHAELTRTFAMRGVDRFGAGSWGRRPGGPSLSDTMAWLDCRIWAEREAGDHVIVIGEVQSMEVHARSAEPLVFWRGAYGTVA